MIAGAAGTPVLFISRQRIVGATNGSSSYLLDLATAVRAAGMVPHLLQPSPALAGRWPVLSMRPEMAVFATHHIRGLIRIGQHFIAPSPRIYLAIARAGLAALVRRCGIDARWAQDRPMPYAIAQPWTARDHAWLRRASRGKAAIAIADYMFCAEGFADLPDPDVPTAIVMHDLFHARGNAAQDSVALVDRAQELAMLGKANAVIAIQSAEAAFVRDELPRSTVVLAPMAAVAVAEAQPGTADEILFVGSNTAPNVVGLGWFLDTVWPTIVAARPDARLTVAGSVARGFSHAAPPGVSFMGLVDDLSPLYARAGVVISPLTFGSGLKIKLVEALAQGKAIVATSVTLQGAEQACAGAVRVCDTPALFAQAVIDLLGDAPARTALAQAALAAARAHFAAPACHADFTRWLLSAERATRMDESRGCAQNPPEPARRTGASASAGAR